VRTSATPTFALLIATASVDALNRVGLPEAGYALAQATTHLACAPKSNRSAVAWWAALANIDGGALLEVSAHLRSRPSRGSNSGTYEYPHDHEGEHGTQAYRPDGVGAHYYVPSDRGAEARISARLASWQGVDPNGSQATTGDT
jgi:putative ATPase